MISAVKNYSPSFGFDQGRLKSCHHERSEGSAFIPTIKTQTPPAKAVRP
jgi:hypothetical protein